MDETQEDRRAVVSLLPAGRVGVVVALLMLIAAAYLFWSPIQIAPQSGGFPIKCGTAANPPNDELGQAACGQANIIRQWQAGSFVAGAVVVVLGSAYAFGARRNDPTRSAITPASPEAHGTAPARPAPAGPPSAGPASAVPGGASAATPATDQA